MNGRGETAGAGAAIISFATHSKHLNYGAVLHGWAFQNVLGRMGCDSVAIDYVPRGMEGYSFKWPVLNALRGWRHPHLIPRRVAQWLVSTRANLRKWRKFEQFKRTRLACTPRVYTERDLASAQRLEGCDPAVFVCESDVIWKRRRDGVFDRGFYLDFPAAAGRRKVAYAPSVAKEPFPPDEERRFAEYLRGFDALSSRERAGAQYVGRVAGRDVPWLLDPTLLLQAEDYAAIAKPSGRSGYILLYTCMNANVNMVREAKRLAARTGKALVEVGNYGINRYIFGHEVIDDAGIEEWLGLFMGADAVVCNSFHGICFSLVFRKQFFAFKRAEDDWRFTGICSELGLGPRLVERDGRIPDNAPDIDFGAVGRSMAGHVVRSLAFIEENIAQPARRAEGVSASGSEAGR